MSTLHDTEPADGAPPPRFLNAAARIETELPPRELLELLLRVEHELGRERPYPGAPRPIDLDLLLYDDAVIDEPGLVVPHPRMHQRAFVLRPWLDIQPYAQLPGHGWVTDLLRAEPVASEVARLTPRPDLVLDAD